jgi:hypothetical protein
MVKKLLGIFIFLLSLSNAAHAQNDDALDKEILEASISGIHDIVASPNPFSVSTRIKFYAEEDIELDFYVKDLLGNTLHSEKLKTKKGPNSISFYRNDLAPGIYIYSLKTKTKIISKRIVIK